MIKTIVFDLDDTLVSEESYILSGYKHISFVLSEKYQIFTPNEIYDELVRLFKENSNYVFNRFFDNHTLEYDNNSIKVLVNEYRTHDPMLTVYDDVYKVLETLKNRKYNLGVITDGYQVSQSKKIDSVSLDQYIDKIIITDLLGREYWKPHKKPFEIMLGYFGNKPEEMIYIGDNPTKDFYIKNELPINTVRIVYDNTVYKHAKYRENIKEDYRINSLNEIYGIIDRIDRGI